jgi:hypothetical protein
MKMKIVIQFLTSVCFIGVSACGGGGGGGDDVIVDLPPATIDTMTIDMSPLRIVGFSDDREVNAFNTLHPLLDLGAGVPVPAGKTWLLRVRDWYEMGDFYSIWVSNGWGVPALGSPTADEGEPDNDPMDATDLTYNIYTDRGLNPLLDEDWFSFTAMGLNSFYFASTIPNMSGSTADPILEVYDPAPNLGPITYVEESDLSYETVIGGTLDSVNNLTLIVMDKQRSNSVDVNSFFLVFSGPPAPGDYPVRFAAPPFPGNAPGTVTGSIHIDQYDGVGGRIIGSFDITIVDDSRTTTVAGNFDVTREPDEPGLLTGFRPGLARASSSSMQGMLKEVSAYTRRD